MTSLAPPSNVSEPVAELQAELAEFRSTPVMDDLHQWFEAQLNERQVEPNSSLGKAITYMLRHWQALTLFLRELGAPWTTILSSVR